MNEEQMARWAEHLTLVGTDREVDMGTSWLQLRARIAELEAAARGVLEPWHGLYNSEELAKLAKLVPGVRS